MCPEAHVFVFHLGRPVKQPRPSGVCIFQSHQLSERSLFKQTMRAIQSFCGEVGVCWPGNGLGMCLMVPLKRVLSFPEHSFKRPNLKEFGCRFSSHTTHLG